MKLAYMMADGRGEIDARLTVIAKEQAARGLRVVGAVQSNCENTDSHLCDMDVQILPDGPLIRISQSLGAEARGCRLDPEALERAVAQVETRLTDQADLLVINKFGKHEADGRGFRETIARALGLGVPVLVGVNNMNHQAFINFCDDAAQRLQGDDDLAAWLEAP